MLSKIDKGIIYMLLASLSFAFMGGGVKMLSHLPSVEVTFFRNVFGVAIIVYILIKNPSKSKGGKPFLLFFRGFIGFLALLAYFYNMANIPLGVATTYNKTSPIFLAIFAWLIFKENLPKTATIALIAGFIGIILIAKPEGFALSKYDLLGLFSGIGAAIAYTSIKELKNYYNTKEIALSFMLVGTIGPILLMIISNYINFDKSLDFMLGEFIMPKGVDWLYIIMVGVLATISQLLMTKSYSITKAGIAGTITYTQILFGTIVGTLLGDTFPDIYTITGMLLITIAGILVALPAKRG